MSKAEEKAMQCCCTKCANNKLNCGMKLLSHGRDCIKCGNYIKGYNQAEKDLELTWEDMREIDKLSGWLLTLKGNSDDKEFFKEVLKRFKNMKDGSKR